MTQGQGLVSGFRDAVREKPDRDCSPDGQGHLGFCSTLLQVLLVPIPQSVQVEYDITVRQEPIGQVPLDGKPF